MSDPTKPSAGVPRRAELKKRALRAALGGNVNLGVLGAGSAGAAVLAMAQGPVVGGLTLLLSAAAYGALVGLDLFNPKFLERLSGPVRSPVATPVLEPGSIESAELRGQYEAVGRAHTRVAAQIAAAEGAFAGSLTELAVRAASLVEEAGQMAQRSNVLVAYLAQSSDEGLDRDASALEARAARTKDAEAAQGFRQAAGARRAQAGTRGEMAALVDRILAQLVLIETSLDEMHARLVKMRAQDAGDVEHIGRGMVARLVSLRDEVQVLESSIDDISASVKGAV